MESYSGRTGPNGYDSPKETIPPHNPLAKPSNAKIQLSICRITYQNSPLPSFCFQYEGMRNEFFELFVGHSNETHPTSLSLAMQAHSSLYHCEKIVLHHDFTPVMHRKLYKLCGGSSWRKWREGNRHSIMLKIVRRGLAIGLWQLTPENRRKLDRMCSAPPSVYRKERSYVPKLLRLRRAAKSLRKSL
ncbi:hypothetical protein QCA50_019292 [Cerrena zonata]|uniref:Uncharacterized protein n=1 Tax=Cerrena zonata TaxID=2478898 RepID=A0AAW0FM01_9APHY